MERRLAMQPLTPVRLSSPKSDPSPASGEGRSALDDCEVPVDFPTSKVHLCKFVIESRNCGASRRRNCDPIRNWRTHSAAQREALQGVLGEVGYAGALLARELEDGSLELD